MIEVIERDGGWTWRMIGADGQPLVWASESWPSDLVAFAHAKAYRAAFWAMASAIDHRMGACI